MNTCKEWDGININTPSYTDKELYEIVKCEYCKIQRSQWVGTCETCDSYFMVCDECAHQKICPVCNRDKKIDTLTQINY